ncbi:AfsR/SARP family transcriptional regulator [Kitasatospora viridis]|uniref:DNA-binding SARP family transcriptional activator n=1 Tax=Kitasatospora viridis TaxID=281105 RepID=A0A561T6F8_9ACTN|nr:AfsR/SARP family transcriptional regulator [Kitasatospora viridis]TWF82696.1 DNA-binding SARP family transcriptional activator [Kitasatospora viridis]
MPQSAPEGGLQFRVLGPIELWNSRRVDLGGLKQRTLMAALLLGAGHVQSVDRLIETLWDGPPPASAPNLVRFYVHQLRKRLGPEGAALLRTAPPGYLLPTEGHQLDLLLFEQLAAEARQAAAQGDHRLAVSRFRAGLALWRGQLLSGTESALLERLYAPRIEESRLTAVEDLVDSELAMGDLAGVVGELSTLVAHHPFRERMHHQLMLALYRSGRRVEALEVFRRLREQLAEEMGIDPGPNLRQLMQEILTDQVPTAPPVPAATVTLTSAPAPAEPPAPAGPVADPGLPRGPQPESLPQPAAGDDAVPPPEPPTPVRSPFGAAAPAMRAPAAIASLVGRDRERRLITDWFRLPREANPSSSPVAVISGLPGVGKSALLAACAQDLHHLYPDGQLYADLAETPIADALADFLVALGVSRRELPRGASQRAGFFRGVTHDRRVLVLLDNVPSEQQARPLLPASPGSAVLLTAAQRLAALENALPVSLEVLDPAGGVAMLEQLLGAERVAQERRAALEIVQFCEGLPLAIRIVAARLALRPDLLLAQLAHRLRDPGRRLDELRFGDLDLRARLRHGYQGLERPAQHLFRLLGSTTHAELTLDRLTRLVGGDPTTGTDALVRAHYLTVGNRDGAYRRLGLVDSFAAELYGGDRLRRLAPRALGERPRAQTLARPATG